MTGALNYSAMAALLHFTTGFVIAGPSMKRFLTHVLDFAIDIHC
jgi:hypothetical protein